MKVTVLGCSGTFPGPDSACSSYLVQVGDFSLLLELGNGALGMLQRFHSLDGIDAVLVTHLHPDHCLDLVPYAYARRFHPDGPMPRIPVYGPTDTRERLSRVFDPPPGEWLADVYEFHLLEPGTMRLGPMTLRLAHLPHPVEALGVRIEAEGRSLCYSADTGESRNLVDLARAADLFICEASYPDEGDTPPGIHLSGRQAADHAARAGARRLMLSHLPPWQDEARTVADAKASAYRGPLTIARTGMVVEV